MAFQQFGAPSRGLCSAVAAGLQCKGTAGRGPKNLRLTKKSSVYVPVWHILGLAMAGAWGVF